MPSPVFTMPTLGHNGRFANQLFQYAFLRICAARRGALVQTLPWAGQDIFGFRDPPVAAEAPTVIAGDEAADPGLYLDRDDPLGDHVEFQGFFQYDTRHYRPHREFIRRLFQLDPKLRRIFDQVVARLRAPGRPVVAVHLRRGDYGHDQFFRAPARWYSEWLRGRASAAQPVIYLCSESPATLEGPFAAWPVLHAGHLPNLSPALAFLLDFHVLTQADEIAASNSSFSAMAAMLNERATAFVRPTLEDRRLVPFDPWNAPVVLPRRLRAGEQAELDACDDLAEPALA
jgi:hypothetical protein